MEYGIRSHGFSVNGGGPTPSSWLESAMASAVYTNPLATAYQLPSSAALFLNSLQSLQSSAVAIELARKSGRRDEEDEEEEEEDDDDVRISADGEEGRVDVGMGGSTQPDDETRPDEDDEYEEQEEDDDDDEGGGGDGEG
ncbi:PREDICTED: nucleolar transcription factor 1-B-like [Ceratosolen solmsi marchali]|uniref:Nucleolar transcription factor 1-B-like n=1 Tax=Ceratosolen solmsi marchali TaxID=326594 RepID=A0AAJ6VMU1_9HYME|nr:PREDICTED: nucleolar transcription factor 1-B-like [Ceratosolen solmsi marchali]